MSPAHTLRREIQIIPPRSHEVNPGLTFAITGIGLALLYAMVAFVLSACGSRMRTLWRMTRTSQVEPDRLDPEADCEIQLEDIELYNPLVLDVDGNNCGPINNVKADTLEIPPTTIAQHLDTRTRFHRGLIMNPEGNGVPKTRSTTQPKRAINSVAGACTGHEGQPTLRGEMPPAYSNTLR